MLAIHYLIAFLMLYLMMFHSLGIPRKRKVLHLNLVVVFIMSITELILGSYHLHYLMPPTFYELTYTALATIMIWYITNQFKKIWIILVLNVFVGVIVTLGALALFSILEFYHRKLLVSPWYSLLGAMAGFILFFCLFLIAKFMKINRVKLGKKGILLIVIGLISYGYYLVSYFVMSRESHFRLIVSLLVLIGGAMPIVVTMAFVSTDAKLRERLDELKEKKHHEEIQALNYSLQEERFRALQIKEEETQKFRHDIRKQTGTSLNLLKEKKYQELEAYLEAIADKNDAIEHRIGVHTGSHLVDGSLNQLLTDVTYKDVTFTRKGVIPPLEITLWDISSLFMNLLTNAFEATVKCPVDNQYVNLIVKPYSDYLYIRIENSYSGNLKFDDEKLQTTKADSANHGYGTKIISDIVEKYGGDYTRELEEGNFISIMIFEKEIYSK